MKYATRTAIVSALLVALVGTASASSHREAPFVSGRPQVDGTDFYMFNSYESGRQGFVTLVADYIPLEDTYAGPSYFQFDPNALYEIEIDNVGDGHEHLTFQFRFTNTFQNAALTIAGKSIPVPLINIGPFGPGIDDGDANKNLIETYTVSVVRGDRRRGSSAVATNLTSGGTTFRKPLDNIGNKSVPDYQTYANNHVFSIGIPGCDTPGKVFVGQRADPFVLNLGEIFDLVNLNPVGPPDAEPNTLAHKAITALELEVSASCLTNGSDPVIGGWTTASMRQGALLNPAPAGLVGSGGHGAPPAIVGGPWVQVSRLGMPLVNEVVIGLPDKDRFNASKPQDDAQFINYVTNPTLPALLQVLFGVRAPTLIPRSDLVEAFLTGIPGLNQQKHVSPSEMLRLNTSTPIVAASDQNSLGVLGSDTAGFPNGRRPGDDVVDISLRVAMGVLLNATDAPDGQLPYTDQASLNATQFAQTFPYLNTPLPGSPNGANGIPAVVTP